MSKKKIVLINQSTGYLMVDVANAYAERYDETVLITGNINTMERELNKNIKVNSIIKYDKKTNASRLLTWLWGSTQIFFKLLFKYRDYDVLYVTNPPMSYFASLLLKRKYSVLVYDTYPDALKNIGLQENSFIFKRWSNINKKIFSKAEQIITIGDNMKLLLTKYVDADKIKVVPNWPSSNDFIPIKREENMFLKEHGIEDKFIVMYSGNMGFTHSVDILLDVAIKMKDEGNVLFLFVGEGKKKADLIRTAEDNNLSNCMFLPFQDNTMFPHSLSSAHLGVVTLNEETAMLSVPSKTYNLMSAGVPILSISPQSSELSLIIKKHNNGMNFNSNEIDNIANFILKCKEDKEYHKSLVDNSFEAIKEYSYHNADKYLIK